MRTTPSHLAPARAKHSSLCLIIKEFRTSEPGACVLQNPRHHAPQALPASSGLELSSHGVLVIKKIQPAPALKELCKHKRGNNMIVCEESSRRPHTE
ncbi:hypothetical protein QTO34_006929 [Cnephaeus nilssonii]|uniref:Uncharacterized protein n=1 Tax=Cnephaeus nilssonii TaxID=3371016 RepID=A0AA40HJA4_CNENI|nr:hypothetical protein QTO34_006929 [Eptesicus nilssonii]